MNCRFVDEHGAAFFMKQKIGPTGKHWLWRVISLVVACDCYLYLTEAISDWHVTMAYRETGTNFLKIFFLYKKNKKTILKLVMQVYVVSLAV